MCLLFGRGGEEAALGFKRLSTSSVCKVQIIFLKDPEKIIRASRCPHGVKGKIHFHPSFQFLLSDTSSDVTVRALSWIAAVYLLPLQCVLVCPGISSWLDTPLIGGVRESEPPRLAPFRAVRRRPTCGHHSQPVSRGQGTQIIRKTDREAVAFLRTQTPPLEAASHSWPGVSGMSENHRGADSGPS